MATQSRLCDTHKIYTTKHPHKLCEYEDVQRDLDVTFSAMGKHRIALKCCFNEIVHGHYNLGYEWSLT